MLKMRKLTRRLLFPLFAIAAATPIWAESPLADKLPGDTMVYAGWKGSAAIGAAYDKSNFKGFLDAIELGKLIEMGMQKARIEAGDNARKIADIKLMEKLAPNVLKYPAAIYFGGVVDVKVENPVPKLAFIVECGKENAATLAKELQDSIDNNPDKKPGDPPAKTAAIGEYLLLTVGESGDIAKRLAGEVNDKTLAENKSFQAAEAQTGKDAALRIYADGPAIVKLIDAAVEEKGPMQARESWAKAAEALGIDGIKSIAISGNFDGPNWKTDLFVGLAEKRTGLLIFMDNQPLTTWAFEAIPKDATWAGVIRSDGKRMMDEIRSVAAAIDDNGPATINRGLETTTNLVGVNIENDILTNLGDEFVYYGVPDAKGSNFADIRAVQKVKDGDALEQAITTLTQFAARLNPQRNAGFKTATENYNNSTIHTMTFDGGSFSWMVKENVFFIASTPAGVKAAHTQIKEKAPNITANAAFADAVKNLGAAKYSSFSFGELAKLGTETYPLINEIQELNNRAAGQPKAEIPPPPFEKIKPFLGTSLGVRWSDKDGFHLASVTPFPGSELLSGEWGMMYSMQKFGLTQQERQLAAAGAANLKKIGTGAAIYAADNNDTYPKDLATLVKSQAISPTALIKNRAKLPAEWNDWTSEKQIEWALENSDFVLVNTGKVEESARKILAYEKFDDKTAKVNVLYGDAKIELISVTELKEKLK
jgi:hypothetical protein